MVTQKAQREVRTRGQVSAGVYVSAQAFLTSWGYLDG